MTTKVDLGSRRERMAARTERRIRKSNELRKRTYDDMLRVLRSDGRCAVIRPTGFGKTWILTKLLKSGIYKHPLYVYPAEVVRGAVRRFYYDDYIPSDNEVPGVEFMTNAKFSRLKGDDIINVGLKHDIIILDECHRMGGEKFGANLDRLLDSFPKLHLLGATATPDRTDAIDILGRYFGESHVFEYTIHDAFLDGILQSPYYIYCAYARPEENFEIIKKDWKANLDRVDDDRDKLALADDLRSRHLEAADFYNMERAIRRNCDRFVDTDYMKFIVFFSRIETLHANKDKVTDWFRRAYPDHDIKTLTISSETKQTTANVKKLDRLTYRENGIDLIFAIDMLNLGYHVDSLTGIVMYRGTSSNIIYLQELGRVLSTGTDRPAIVFDVVDNLHNNAMYDILGRESVYTKNARARREYLDRKEMLWTSFASTHNVTVSIDDLRRAEAEVMRCALDIDDLKADGASDAALENAQRRYEMAYDSAERIRRAVDKLDAVVRKYFDGKGLEEVEFTEKDASEKKALDRRFDSSGSLVSDARSESMSIKKEHLIVVDELAAYKELVRKMVAEPLAYRSNQVWQNYLEAGGMHHDKDGNPFTSKEQFLETVSAADLPIEPFCKRKRITVDDIMEYVLGFPRDGYDKPRMTVTKEELLPKSLVV